MTQLEQGFTMGGMGHKRTLPHAIMNASAAIGRRYRRYGSLYVIEKSRGESPKSGH